MSSAIVARLARARLTTASASRFRPAVRFVKPATVSFSSAARLRSDPHAEESFEEFSARYELSEGNVLELNGTGCLHWEVVNAVPASCTNPNASLCGLIPSHSHLQLQWHSIT